MLNQQTLTGNWNQIKGKVREKWGQITDDDLEALKGKGDQLVGAIQRKTGIAREQIEKFLDQTVAEGSSMASQAAETARRYGQQAISGVQDASEQIGDSIGGGYDEAERMVRRRPAESIGAAFGMGLAVGFVAGLILHSRR